MEEEKPINRILILGGSTFVGLTLLRELSNKYTSKNKDSNETQRTELYYINRGKNYWNNKIKQIPNLIYINGNRSDKEEFQKLLQYTSKKLGINEQNKWTSVIDMCAFKWQNIRSVYLGLKGLVHQYIFISTDSVYDVCDPSIRGKRYKKTQAIGEITSDPSHFSGQKILEEWDQRFPEQNERDKAKKDEDYGHAKLMCEEYMQNEIDKSQFPFIILRFADVIGPYDDSGRFWSYIKWMMDPTWAKKPLPQDKETQNNLLSFVFSEDIVKTLLYFVKYAVRIEQQYQQDPQNSPLFKAMNLACEESLTLDEFLKEAYNNIPQDKRANSQFVQEQVKSAPAFYPSVECGPIDIMRAKHCANWQPSSIKEAIKKTTQFFVGIQLSGEYKTESKYAEGKLNKKFNKEKKN